MNYSKIYDQLIHRAQCEDRQKGQGIYYEKHHITPRCLGGENLPYNLVLLTGKEHFLVHWLLIRMYPENKKICSAFWLMCHIKGNKNQKHYTPSSRAYAEAREKFSTAYKGYVTPEHVKEKISKANKGRKRSKEFCEQLSKRQLGISKHTDEAKSKISKAFMGKNNPRFGIKLSQDIKDRIRASLINRKKIAAA